MRLSAALGFLRREWGWVQHFTALGLLRRDWGRVRHLAYYAENETECDIWLTTERMRRSAALSLLRREWGRVRHRTSHRRRPPPWLYQLMAASQSSLSPFLTQASHCSSSFRCCLMTSDVGWHIRDKLRPMREHGSILLCVHGNHKAR